MNRSIKARNCLWQSSLLLLTTLLCAGRAQGAPHGELDATFGENGRLTIGPRYESTLGNAVVQQPTDGKLVVAGATWVTPSGWYDFMVLRRNLDGSPDHAFGTGGAVLIDFGGPADIATDLAVQVDGKIVVAGYAGFGPADAPDFDIALTRLNQDGSIDSTFGSGGLVTLDLGGRDEYVSRIALLPDGKIVVVGATNRDGDHDVLLARFDSNGTLDAAFGTGPVAGTTLVDSSGGVDQQPYGLAIQADGKFIACGQSGPRAYDAAGGQMLAIRVNADGSVDTGFGANGVSLIATGEPHGGGRGCVAMPDGTTVLAGFAGRAGNADLLLARLSSDGVLDSSFGAAGLSRIDLGGSESAQSIIRLADGKLAVTGLTNVLENEFLAAAPRWTFDMPSGISDTLVARIDTGSGLLDPVFGNDGITLVDFGEPRLPSFAFGRGLIQQGDGKLLAVGTFAEWGDWWNYRRIAMARIDTAGTGNAGRIGFVDTHSSVAEGTASVVVSVRRTGGSTGAISVDYDTLAGRATAPEDFTATSGTLTWSSGDMSPKLIQVPITNDDTVEQIEWFSIELSNASGYLGNNGIQVSIINDDVQPGVIGGGGGGGGGGSGGGGGGAAGIEALMSLALLWAHAIRRRRRERRSLEDGCRRAARELRQY